MFFTATNFSSSKTPSPPTPMRYRPQGIYPLLISSDALYNDILVAFDRTRCISFSPTTYGKPKCLATCLVPSIRQTTKGRNTRILISAISFSSPTMLAISAPTKSMSIEKYMSTASYKLHVRKIRQKKKIFIWIKISA